MTELQQSDTVTTIAMDAIVIDPAIQPRQGDLDVDHVAALKESGPGAWPPLVVTARDDQFVLIAGHHRLAAAKHLKLEQLACRVEPMPSDGDLHALAFALNKEHGKPLTLGERKAEAKQLLRADASRSDRDLAGRCGLSDKTVATLRHTLESTAKIPQLNARTGVDGKTRRSPAATTTKGATVGTSQQAGTPRKTAASSKSTSPPPVSTPSQPDLAALHHLVDQTCTFLEEHAGEEFGSFVAQTIVDRWSDVDRPDLEHTVRTLGQQFLDAADRLAAHTHAPAPAEKNREGPSPEGDHVETEHAA